MKKRFFKPKQDGLSIDQIKFEAGSPSKERISSGSEHFDFVAFRDLAFRGAIEPKADPNTEAAKGSYPYAILNRTNRVLEANYPGYQNLSGNSIVRLQNSVSSQFLNYLDSIVMVKRLNYLYLSYNATGINAAYNYEMVKAFEQALAYGYSTMLTQLPFYSDYVATDLPRISGSPFYGNNDDTYDRMGALLHYQIVMQNIVSPLAKYVETLSLEDELMDMSYRREAPLIQQLFGQLKKKAFVAQLNSIGTVVIGEYFDDNWWKQMNALRHVPSREANDMNHPLVTMVTSHIIPRLRLWAEKSATLPVTTPYYDSNTDLVYTVAANTFLDPETFEKSAQTNWSLEQIVVNLNKLMDAHYILTWARKLTSNILGVNAIKEAAAYYQAIYLYVSALSYIASRFGSKMTEIRTFLDKLNDTGMVYWKKGIKFDISRVFPKSLTYNQIVADLLKSTLSGAKQIKYDATTMRWVCNTEWNMYTGINKFDKFSGGSFLTFSVRDISLVDSGGNTISKTSSTMLIPILFEATPVFQPETGTYAPKSGHSSACVKMVSRLGFDVYVDTFEITNSNIDTDRILSRLNPLGDPNLSIKAPNINENHFDAAYTLSTAEIAHMYSAFNKVLLQIAQYNRLAKSTQVYSNVDPDLIAIIDLQIEDVSNAMIQFARNYSPFRVNTLDGKRTIGFGKDQNNIAG